MAKRNLSSSAVILVMLVALASSALQPACAASVPTLAIDHVSAAASGRALPRLTTVVPKVPGEAESGGLIQLDLAGVVSNAGDLPFHVDLQIRPGASVWVEDTVFNMLQHVEGSFEFGEPESQRAWQVVGIRDGVWFPKTYFKGGDLRILLPLEFSYSRGPQLSGLSGRLDSPARVRAIVLLRCVVSDQRVECATSKFVFGNALNAPSGPFGSVSDLVPLER